jgi:DNA-binding transcriptional LysR family regulator
MLNNQIDMSPKRRLDYLKDRHLRLLTALAEEKQLGRAAARIGISQPAASKALTEIEENAQAQLFIRGPHETIPTTAGRVLIGYAEHCLGETRRASEELEALSQRQMRVLRVGMLASVAATLIPVAATALLAQHPETEITLEEGVMGQLVEKLRRSEIDLFVGRIDGVRKLRPARPASEFEEWYLVDDPLTVVCRPDHPVLTIQTITLGDIYAFPWILPLKQTRMREEVDRILQVDGRGAACAPLESNSPVANIGLLQNSDRLAVMSRAMARKWVAAGMIAIVPVEIDFHPGAIGVVARRNDAHLQAIAQFVEVLRSLA